MRWKSLLTICCLSWCISTQAQPRELQISVGDWPPYLSTDQRHNGVMAHIISDLFAEEGYKVNFRFLPWPRAYSDAAAGKFDATGVWMHKRERETDFLFSAPLLDEQFVFFHLKSVPFDWQQFDDLTGMTLGVGLEYSYGPGFDAFLARGKVRMERVSSDQQNFEKLLKERIVLYPQEVNVGYAALRSQFTPAERAHHPPSQTATGQPELPDAAQAPGRQRSPDAALQPAPAGVPRQRPLRPLLPGPAGRQVHAHRGRGDPGLGRIGRLRITSPIR